MINEIKAAAASVRGARAAAIKTEAARAAPALLAEAEAVLANTPEGEPCICEDAGHYYAGIRRKECFWDSRAQGGWSSNPDGGWEVDGWRDRVIVTLMDKADPRFEEWAEYAAQAEEAALDVRNKAIAALQIEPRAAFDRARLAKSAKFIPRNSSNTISEVVLLATGEKVSIEPPPAIAATAALMNVVMEHDEYEFIGIIAAKAAELCPDASGILNAVCYRPALWNWKYESIAKNWKYTLSSGVSSSESRRIRNRIRRENGITLFIPRILGGDGDE